jgi:hypothetical protein
MPFGELMRVFGLIVPFGLAVNWLLLHSSTTARAPRALEIVAALSLLFCAGNAVFVVRDAIAQSCDHPTEGKWVPLACLK